jgi:hypothetical protein
MTTKLDKPALVNRIRFIESLLDAMSLKNNPEAAALMPMADGFNQGAVHALSTLRASIEAGTFDAPETAPPAAELDILVVFCEEDCEDTNPDEDLCEEDPCPDCGETDCLARENIEAAEAEEDLGFAGTIVLPSSISAESRAELVAHYAAQGYNVQ